MSRSPYQLCDTENRSDTFYAELRDFSQHTYNSWFPLFSEDLKEYASFITTAGDSFRSYEEYTIELITMAMLWQEYRGAAQKTPPVVSFVLRKMTTLRRHLPLLKGVADRFRGYLSGIYIYPNLGSTAQKERTVLGDLQKLLFWLHSTGEFSDEVKRLRLWNAFLQQKGEPYAQALFEGLQQKLSAFQDEAEEKLGPYTAAVAPFHQELPRGERWREDALFRHKSALEYHINMIATEIINSGLHDAFLQTTERIVLVPACMCKEGNRCKREERQGALYCTHCSEKCMVHRSAAQGEKEGFTLNIVPHSSGAIQWLQRWKDQTKQGIVAIACPLNIVSGGYRMRSLNIPSQCLLLDYAGCAKHWGPEANPTSVNLEHLLSIVNEKV